MARIEQSVFGVASKLKIPYAVIEPAIDAVKSAMNFQTISERRRDAAERVSRFPDAKGRMPQETGYALFQPGDIPTAAKAVEACQEIFKLRHKTVVPTAQQTMHNLLDLPADLDTYPELLEFAQSPEVMATVSDYLGATPDLQNINLWYSPVHTELRGSHLFHLDKPNVQFIGVFLNVFDVTENEGPLVILPAGKSDEAERKLHYRDRYIAKSNARLTDEEMLSGCDESDLVRFTGPVGTSYIVDTSRCFHYGSRCTVNPRAALQLRFALPYRHPSKPEFQALIQQSAKR